MLCGVRVDLGGIRSISTAISPNLTITDQGIHKNNQIAINPQYIQLIMVMDESEWDIDKWRIYQKIAAGIHAQKPDARVEIEYPYPINSGGKKEVDIVVWDNSGRYQNTTLIECKDWDAPIGQDVVDSLNGYLKDSDADKGVIIARSGFQSGAKERAEGSGVELWTLKRLVPDEDFAADEVQRIEINLLPRFRDIDVENIELTPLNESEDRKGKQEEIRYEFTERNSQLYTHDREHRGETLTELLTNWMNHHPVGEHTEKFDNTAILLNGEFFKVHSIDYRIIETQNESNFTVDAAEEFDLLFRNELTGERELIKLEKAVNLFLENIDESDTRG